MSVGIEKARTCALQVLTELGYDIDETVSSIEGSRPSLEEIQFSVRFNEHRQIFEPQNSEQIKDSEKKRLLDVLNRHLKLCLERN